MDKVLKLIESVREKQGEMPAPGSQEELREREKLLKMAQNLHQWMATDDPIEKDVYGNRKASIELDATTFYPFLESHKFVMVDFHAPWCPHCQHFDPTWQQFAFVINQHTYRRGAEINTRGKAAIATVNCVENQALCTRELIQGYPTVRVYRNGASGTVFTWEEHFDSKENKTYYFNPVTKVASWEKPMRMSVAHTEEYMGQRDVQSLIAFVDVALTESLQFEGYKVGANQLPILDTIDVDGNGESDSRLVTKGCTVEGFVTMSRVPGSLKFRSVGKDTNMDPDRVNMTHTVNHLSFGNRLKPYELRTLLRQDLGSEGRTAIPSVNWNYNKDFTSKVPRLCHEHYIKIVSTTFKYLSGQQLATYEYTINSNKLIEHTAASEQALVPSTTFRFDLVRAAAAPPARGGVPAPARVPRGAGADARRPPPSAPRATATVPRAGDPQGDAGVVDQAAGADLRHHRRRVHRRGAARGHRERRELRVQETPGQAHVKQGGGAGSVGRSVGRSLDGAAARGFSGWTRAADGSPSRRWYTPREFTPPLRRAGDMHVLYNNIHPMPPPLQPPIEVMDRFCRLEWSSNMPACAAFLPMSAPFTAPAISSSDAPARSRSRRLVSSRSSLKRHTFSEPSARSRSLLQPEQNLSVMLDTKLTLPAAPPAASTTS